MSQEERKNDGGLVVERARPKLAKPPLFKVVLINDDYTPMEFVVEVLQVFFNLDWEQAHVIMLHVHQKGKVFVVYTPERLPKPKWLWLISFLEKASTR